MSTKASPKARTAAVPYTCTSTWEPAWCGNRGGRRFGIQRGTDRLAWFYLTGTLCCGVKELCCFGFYEHSKELVDFMVQEVARYHGGAVLMNFVDYGASGDIDHGEIRRHVLARTGSSENTAFCNPNTDHIIYPVMFVADTTYLDLYSGENGSDDD